MAQTARQSNQDTIISRLVQDHGLATDEEVKACQRKQRELAAAQKNASLAAVMIAQGVVTKRQLERLKPEVEDEKSAGQAAQQIPGFQIIKQLGAGAMATVYLAKQLSLDRLVAVKILPKKFTNNKDFIDRFYAEGRAAGKLNHPNIVGALDVGKSGELYYFVMEYVEGASVFEDLQDNGRYSEKRALDLIIQTAKGLDHAHKAGLIHRDVKPKNIMIDSHGSAKLADMGLARAVDDREAAESEKGKAFGTPYYISPEQIRGLTDVDARADIYGLGATFYHMVTGQVPFDAPNPTAVMQKHLRDELVQPDRINPDLSQGVCEVIEVMMAKDRSKRYASTGDLLADLEAVKRGEPPMQARKAFDISALAGLEEGDDATATNGNIVVTETSEPSLTANPLFWAAVAGWAFGLICLLALIATLILSG